MFKFKRVVCVLAVCATVGAAFALPRKILEFNRFNAESLEADGMAFISHTTTGNDKTTAQVILSDFIPNTPYVVIVLAAGPVVLDRITEPGITKIGLFRDLSEMMIAGTDGLLQTSDKGRLTVHLTSTAFGDLGQFIDSVAVVTLENWNARVQNEPPPLNNGGLFIRLSAIGGAISQLF